MTVTPSGTGLTVSGTVNTTDLYRRRVGIFVGFANTVSSATSTYTYFEAANNNAGSLNFTVTIPAVVFANMGAITGTTLYFAAYGINSNYAGSSSYVDNTNGRRIYTALSSTFLTASGVVP